MSVRPVFAERPDRELLEGLRFELVGEVGPELGPDVSTQFSKLGIDRERVLRRGNATYDARSETEPAVSFVIAQWPPCDRVVTADLSGRPEVGAEHADDHQRVLLEHERLAQHARVGAVPPDPEAVVEHCDAVRRRGVVVGSEEPAQRRAPVEHIEELGARDADGYRFRIPVTKQHVVELASVDHVFQRTCSFSELTEVADGDWAWFIAAPIEQRAHEHEPLRVVVGQRTQHHTVHHAEDRRRSADAENDRCNC